MGRDWYPMPRTTERRCPLVWCLDDWNFRYVAGTLIKVINHPGYWDACRCKLAYLRVHLVVTEPWSHDKIVLMQKISNHPSSSHLESSTARVGKNSMDTLFDVAVVSGLKMQNTGLRAVLGWMNEGLGFGIGFGTDVRLWNPYQMSCNVKKRTFWPMRPTKTLSSLRIRAGWSESSLSACRNFASLAIQNAFRADFDQSVSHYQADPNIHWAHMSEVIFSDLTAQSIDLFI